MGQGFGGREKGHGRDGEVDGGIKSHDEKMVLIKHQFLQKFRARNSWSNPISDIQTIVKLNLEVVKSRLTGGVKDEAKKGKNQEEKRIINEASNE